MQFSIDKLTESKENAIVKLIAFSERINLITFILINFSEKF